MRENPTNKAITHLIINTKASFNHLFGWGTPLVSRLRAFFLLFFTPITIVLFWLTIAESDTALWRHTFRVCMSGFVGFFTNYIAIKMLFHPKEPLPITKWQGLVPKNKARLGLKIGEEVQNKLLSPDAIAAHVADRRLFEKASTSLLRKARAWIDDDSSRDRMKIVVGTFIQNIGRENLDDIMEKALNNSAKALISRKTVKSLLDFLRDSIRKMLTNNQLREKLSNAIDRLTGSFLLTDEGPVAILINNGIDDLKDLLKNSSVRRQVGSFLLDNVRKLKDSHVEEFSNRILGNLEKRLSNYRETGKLVDSISGWLTGILNNPEVVQFVSQEICSLLESNSDTLGRQISDKFKNSGNFLERMAKKTFIADSWIIDAIRNMGESEEFQATVSDLLQERADVSKLLSNSGSRAKLISYLSKSRHKVIFWCKKNGVPLLEKAIDNLIASENTWEFLIGAVDKFSEEISLTVRKHLPEVMSYIRELLERQHIGESVLQYISDHESEILERISSPDTAEKIQAYINENKEKLTELIDAKLRPLLLEQSRKLLSSETFWKWIEAQLNRMIPLLSSKLRKFVQSESMKKRVEKYLPEVSKSLKISEIVEGEVGKFTTDDLENMISNVSGDNLAGIEVFGGILGLVAGTLTIANEAWYIPAGVILVVVVWLLGEMIIKKVKAT